MTEKTTFLPRLSLWQGLLLAFFAGATTTLSFAPLNLWSLSLFTPFVLYYLLDQCKFSILPSRSAFQMGLSFGLGYFSFGISWIFNSIYFYGQAPVWLCVLVTAGLILLMSFYHGCQSWFWQRSTMVLQLHGLTPWLKPLGFAASWVVADIIRGWLFTGFPWLYLGATQVNTPLAGLIPVLGVHGETFALLLLVTFAYHSMVPVSANTTNKVWARAFLVVLLLIFTLTNQHQWTKRTQGSLSVGLAQGDIPQDLKFSADSLNQIIDTYDILSTELWQQELILWPETALPIVEQDSDEILNYFNTKATESNSALITGIFSQDSQGVYNSITVLGHGQGHWYKEKLVPFGEYIPLRDFLSDFFQLFSLPMSSLSAGKNNKNLLEIKGWRLSPFICYEVVYGDFVRKNASEADLLVTISNDTWFGASWGPHQHLQIARLRSAELGKMMLRSTNDGITAIISADGSVIKQAPQFVKATLTGEVYRYEGLTPYAQTGSWPIAILSLFLCLSIVWIGIKSRATKVTM